MEQIGDEPLEEYRRVLEEKVNITSTKRGCGTPSHAVAIYEQTMKGLSYFYPQRIFEADGNLTIRVHVKMYFVASVKFCTL